MLLGVIKMAIFKDEERNTWYFEFSRVVNGKRHHIKRRGFKTKNEAKVAEFEALQSVTNPEFEIERITVDDLFEEFIAHNRTKNKITTIHNKQKTYRPHIKPKFGDLAACEITSKQLTSWKEKLLKNDYSQATFNKILGLMRALIKFGLDKGYIKDNRLLADVENVSLHKVSEERNVWTIEQLEQFLDTFDLEDEKQKDYHDYFLCLFVAGCRPNEFRCLQKQDIKGNYITICKNVTSKIKNGVDIIMTPKNASSIRDIIMPDDIIQLINERTKDYKPTDYIFGKDRMFRETNLLRFLKHHSKLAGLEPIVLYGFRHSSATHMLRSGGVPLKVISRRLGHINTSTTINTYIHLFKEDEALALGAFDFKAKKKSTD